MANGDKLTIGANNDATEDTTLTQQSGVKNSGVLDLFGGYYGLLASATNTAVSARATEQDGVGVRGEVGTLLGQVVPGVAVQGYSGQGLGVQGLSDSDVGVYRSSLNYHGVVGKGATNGVYGWSQTGCGVVGQAFSSNPEAFGVFAWGSIGCTGAKYAAVPHAGGHRLLYSVESPECWFEDFGRAKLQRGRAGVAIRNDFAPLVKTDDYHVFLTAEGDCNGLFVSRKTRKGFEVRELRAGKSSIGFTYRLVAKRRDIPAPRLPRVRLAEPKPETLNRPEPRKLARRGHGLRSGSRIA